LSARHLELASPQCSADDFDGEIVAINLETGIYYSIKESGAVLWHDLAAGHSVEALVELAGANPELAAGIVRFADELVSCGLMRPTTEAPIPGEPAATAAQIATMTAPALESFGDMQDLLLLDPVHEVDEEMGWPKVPE
jgi:hypothetical protein